MMDSRDNPVSLLELNTRVSRVLSESDGLNDVWVTGETSDLRVSGPHCYFELIDKDPDTGAARARARATIWAYNWARISRAFMVATGSQMASGIKVMVKASVTFHPVYGLSLNVTDVDPSYTMGDVLRRRQEMLRRLQTEGILEQNRSLRWPDVPWRIAVVSAEGAAGYGDFINQLYTNPRCLRFATELFPAVMQGERAPASILAALEAVADRMDLFDCVVIIRGGGATGDLTCFDNYELAANIALFPLPVVVGIGHERDVTLLDYVANMRVKTPTAAAEWLISRGCAALDRVINLGHDILSAATSSLSSANRRLENLAGQMPATVREVMSRAAMRVGPAADDTLRQAIANLIASHTQRLDSCAAMIETLSPEATLRRGFSITRVDGHAISSPEEAPAGAEVHTTLAGGVLISKILKQ